MGETIVTRGKRKTVAEYEHTLDLLLDEMSLLDAAMDNNEVEIGHYKEETVRLLAENRIVLDRIKAMF